MALLQLPPDQPHALSQGDLIKVDCLHSTGAEGAPMALEAEYALVVSRDCVAEHKDRVVVAPTIVMREPLLPSDPLKDGSRSTSSKKEKENSHKANFATRETRFDALLKALGARRDGCFSPDRFYLGPIPKDGNEDRLVAHLDELSTIHMPSTNLPTWLAGHLVARLSTEARHALLTRLYWAFARVGFDDHEWLPTPDLEAVCQAGESALAAGQMELGDLGVEYQNAKARGVKPEHLSGLEQKKDKLKGEIDRFGARIQPYLDARNRRSSAQ